MTVVLLLSGRRSSIDLALRLRQLREGELLGLPVARPQPLIGKGGVATFVVWGSEAIEEAWKSVNY